MENILTGLTEEQLNSKKEVLRNTYLMYEDTKKNAAERYHTALDENGNRIYSERVEKENLELIQTMQQDIIDEYLMLGGTKEELEALNNTKSKHVNKRQKKEKVSKKDIIEYVQKMNYPSSEAMDEYVRKTTEKHEKMMSQSILTSETKKEDETNAVSNNKQMYDTVKLPSKGLCYRSKISELNVAYLTAYDENMILSPSLYRDGTFLDFLIKEKVLNNIDVDDMLPGDRDAIIIWLRANGYGPEYNIVVNDPETGTEFETVFDLSTLKFKDFKLEADENGYFDFVLPISKDVVKFKFLTIGDLAYLKSMKQEESNRANITNLRRYIDDIEDCVEDNSMITNVVKNDITKLIRNIQEKLIDIYDGDTDDTFTHELTNKLILNTISINGIKDRKYITNYIENMSVKDAAEYRKYISNNEPGIDYNITVNKPEGLGGGSFNTFLQLNQFIFIDF